MRKFLFGVCCLVLSERGIITTWSIARNSVVKRVLEVLVGC